MSDSVRVAQQFALKMVETRTAELEQKAGRRYEPSGNYASGLYDCPRAAFFNRALWDVRPGIPAHVHARLEMGEVIHKWAAKWLMERFNVLHVELPLNYKPWDLRGRVDMVVAVEDEAGNVHRLPVEVKSITDQAWSKCRDLEALMEQEWTRKYVRQLWAYMLVSNIDAGILLFVGLPSGNINPVVVELDYEKAEQDVAAFCETVNEAMARFSEKMRGKPQSDREAIAEETAPAPIQHDPTVCGRCPWFGRTCFPARTGDGQGLLVLSDPEFVGDLTRMKELEPLAKEHESIKKRVKARLEGVETAIAGNWAIRGRKIRTKRLSIPKQEQDKIKAAHPEWMKEISYWRHTIEPLMENQAERWAQTDVAERIRRILKQQED